MATVTQWTVEDLAVYCEYCMVIVIHDGDKYCDSCADDIAEYLAQRFAEQQQVDKGWY